MDLGTGLTAATGLTVVRPYLEKLIGPSADAIGNHWAGAVTRRLERASALVERVSEICPDPHQVPDKVFWPLVEHASLEDDEVLREMWAQLLASAASGEAVHPALTTIMSQMSPLEARLLASASASPPLHEAVTKWRDGSAFRLVAIRPSERFIALGEPVASLHDQSVAVDNLIRMGVIESDSSPFVMRPISSKDEADASAAIAMMHTRQKVAVTALGLSLIATIVEPTPPID